jgi:predicted O-methyltransferase YrrM
MSILTEYMIDGSNGLLSLQDEPSDPRWQCFNTGSVEVEVAEFLYAFVRMTKPTHILETGTHKGISAAYMGTALKDNEQSMDEVASSVITTIEFEAQHLQDASKLISALSLDPWVHMWYGSSLHYPGMQDLDLIFLDTEPQIRFKEFERFVPFLKPGGYIFIHDLHAHLGQVPNEEHGFAWPYGSIPEQMRYSLSKGFMRPFSFETPRGLTGFYRVAADTWDVGAIDV